MTPRVEDRDRDLVREAFESTRVPPATDLAARVRERVWQERIRAAGARLPLACAAAAGGAVLALLAALVVDSGYLELPLDQSPRTAPTSALAGRAAADVGPTILLPGAGGPGASGLRRLGWSGRALGVLSSSLDLTGASVSPDGALLAVPDAAGQGAAILDPTGRPVAHVAAFGAWSGDAAHAVCALDAGGDGAHVELADLDGRPGPAAHRVAVTGGGGPDGRWRLLGCSARADVLVAVRMERRGPGPDLLAAAARIQLSSGRVLSRVDFADQPAATGPVLSPDARYLAENDPLGRTAAIRDLLTGDVVGHLGGAVAAFSGDDQLVLVNGGTPGPDPAPRAALVDWRWDRTAWTGPGPAEALAVRPAGRDLVLSLAGGADGDARTLLVAAGGRRVIDLDPARPGRPLQG